MLKVKKILSNRVLWMFSLISRIITQFVISTVIIITTNEPPNKQQYRQATDCTTPAICHPYDRHMVR